MDSPKTILKTIKAAERILIPFHRRPDGDMVGSALAFYHFLRSANKATMMVSSDPVPQNFFFLPGSKRIKIQDPAKMDLSKFDLLVLLDNGDPFRYSKAQRVQLPPSMLLINIDHHNSNREFGDLNYVNKKAAATAEILFDLFKAWKVRLTSDIANCLLTSIYTDTLGFESKTTSADSLFKAAYLIKRGANREKIIENAFQSWSPKAPKIWAVLLNNMKVRKNTAYSQIPYSELKKIGCTTGDLATARGFAASKLLLGVEGIKVSVIFTEEEPNQVRVSMRSSGKFNVGRIAELMGGGGHINSAAFDYSGKVKNVVSKTLKHLTK